MISNLSSKLAVALCDRGILAREDESLYAYGIHILITTVGTSIVILTLGLVFRVFIETIFFLFSFSLIRKYAGGFHASDGKCFVYSILTALAYILILRFSDFTSGWNVVFPVIVLLMSVIIIILFAPIQSNNKPLDEKETRQYGKIAKTITCVLAAVSLLLLLFNMVITISVAIICGINLAALSLAVARYKK